MEAKHEADRRDEVTSLQEQAASILDRAKALAEKLTDRNTQQTVKLLLAAAENAVIARQLLFFAARLPEENVNPSGQDETQPDETTKVEAEPTSKGLLVSLLELFTSPWGSPALQVNLMDNQPNRTDESCCVTDQPCCKGHHQHAEDTPRKKPVLPESVVPVIFIAPGTDEYLEGDQPLEAGDADKAKPVPPIDDQLPKAQPGEGDRDTLTCVVVPSRKDLATSLLSGARRFLGFADTSMTSAEDNFAGECCDLETGECGPNAGNKPKK